MKLKLPFLLIVTGFLLSFPFSSLKAAPSACNMKAVNKPCAKVEVKAGADEAIMRGEAFIIEKVGCEEFLENYECADISGARGYTFHLSYRYRPLTEFISSLPPRKIFPGQLAVQDFIHLEVSPEGSVFMSPRLLPYTLPNKNLKPSVTPDKAWEIAIKEAKEELSPFMKISSPRSDVCDYFCWSILPAWVTKASRSMGRLDNNVYFVDLATGAFKILRPEDRK